MSNKEIKKIGFDQKKEVNFLKRLDPERRNLNLELELVTQLAEDFGMVEFTKKYEMRDGVIVDDKSGQEMLELTLRGGVEEEVESMKKIQEGLNQNPEKIFVHFSPKNEKLGYPSNCIDFWRNVDGKVVWNRILVENDFKDMKRIRNFLGDGKEIINEMDILKSPISLNLKLAEIFSLFDLCKAKHFQDLDLIENTVFKCLKEFGSKFGSKLIEDEDLIFRMYSACFNGLRERNNGEVVISRRDMENYMYGVMTTMKTEKSFGCAATTTVGIFGEKTGYYILNGGEVKHGKIPEGFKECKECGCWYGGEKCPFC